MFFVIGLPIMTHFSGPLVQSFIDEIGRPVVPVMQRPCINDQCDFMSFWAAGRLERSGALDSIYNPDDFEDWQRTNVGPNKPSTPWIYPPPVMILPFIVAPLSFELGYLVWSLSLSVASVLLLRFAGVSWRVIAAGLLSLPALLSLRLGQFGMITGSLLISGLMMASNRPAFSGGVFGLLIIKPQAGLLAPFVLMAKAQWRGVLTAAASALSLCLIVTFLLGTVVWKDFFMISIPVAKQLLNAPFPTQYETTGISVFWMLRSWGWAVLPSNIVHFSVAVFAVCVCFAVWRSRHGNAKARVAMTAFLSLLISPYGYIGDMCAYSLGIALLAEQVGKVTTGDMLLWLAPGVCLIAGLWFHILFAPFVIGIACMRAYRLFQHG